MLDVTTNLTSCFKDGDQAGFEPVAALNDVGGFPDEQSGDVRYDSYLQALVQLNERGGADDVGDFRTALGLCSIIQHHWETSRFDDDTQGRSLWCFGHCYKNGMSGFVRNWGKMQFDRAVNADVATPCGMAFAALGAAFMLDVDPDQGKVRNLLCELGSQLFQILKPESRPDWTWFETVVADDSPHLADALMRAGTHLNRQEWKVAAADARHWITVKGHISRAAIWSVQPLLVAQPNGHGSRPGHWPD
jgi:hypothetical protein